MANKREKVRGPIASIDVLEGYMRKRERDQNLLLMILM